MQKKRMKETTQCNVMHNILDIWNSNLEYTFDGDITPVDMHMHMKFMFVS